MRRPYRKLNLDERRILATMLQAKATKTKIAETLGRDRSTIHTLIERKTRYTVLLRNNDRKSRPLMNKLINEMSPLPANARRSITFDRGFEFTSWRELHKGMGTKSWFCDPQAPWQKGSVENMNKRVRRYLPRDTALLSLPNRCMRSICDRLNATPRKCLGYRTPAEAFRDELMKLEQ